MGIIGNLVGRVTLVEYVGEEVKAALPSRGVDVVLVLVD